MLLSMAVLAAIGLARVIDRVRSPRMRAAIAAAAVALAIVEYRSAPALATVPSQLPLVYEWLRRRPPTVIAELPLPIVDRNETVHESTYVYYSTFHWHRIVNGTSGYYPASYSALLDRMRSFPDTAGLDALRQRGVETIVVHEAFHTPDRYGAVVAWLNEQPGVEAVGRFPGPSPASEFRVSQVASPATAPR